MLAGHVDEVGGVRLKPIAVQRFTTDAFAPRDRHQAWESRDWPAIGPLFESRPLGLFHNHSERFALGRLTVHLSDMGAQRYTRSQARARRDGVDTLLVELLLEGATTGEAAGLPLANSAGRMIFDDLAQAHTHVTTDTRTLLLSIPRAVATRNGIDVAALHGRSVSAEATGLLRSHLLGVRALLPRLEVAQGDRLAQVALDLIGVALDVDGLRAPAAGPEARALAAGMEARRLIEQHLGEAFLTPDWLCGQLGISRSRLYRLFEQAGGVQAHIRMRRLERIAKILTAPGNTDRIADIAASWGFHDAAHLGRAFRQQFGLTPAEYRASATDA